MLANLLSIPRTGEQWALWSFNHRTSHDAIRAAIQAKKGVTLADYPIDPIPNFETFLEVNSQLHTDMNGQLGTPGVDLQDANLEDEREKTAWIFLHYQEHYVAETALGI